MFIAIEGVAGAGKSTQVKLLKEYLESTYEKQVFVSAAFEGIRRKITEEFISSLNIKNDIATVFLFQVLHSLQREEVSTNLKAGNIVIADRWRHSFFAYNDLFGELAKESQDFRNKMDELTFKDVNPDFTIYIDMPYNVAYNRFKNREKLNKTFESIDLQFFKTTVEYYKHLQNKHKWISIDGNRDKDVVFLELKQVIDENYNKL